MPAAAGSALNGERKKLDARRKAGELSPEVAQAAKESLRAKEFSVQEYLLLKSGISNQEYHYLGSAKILCRIGEAFADAMLDLTQR